MVVRVTKNKKQSKFIRLIKVVFLVLVIGVVGSVLYKFVINQITELKKLEFSNSSKNELISSDQNPEYSQKKPFTLLFLVEFDSSLKDQIDGFLVVQLNPITQQATLLSIHPDVYMYSKVYCIDPDDTQLVRIKDLFVVGELQTPSRSCAYTLYSIEEMLAIPIDGYVYIDGDEIEEFVEMGSGERPDVALEGITGYQNWSEGWNDYWVDLLDSVSLIKIWRHRDIIADIESNMNVVDVYSFIEDFKSVKNDDISSVVIEDEQLEEVVNNKGDIVSLVTENAWDEALKDHLVDYLVDREQARIEIFNGSRIDGLGARYQRWVEHLGADVIRVQNAPGEWENTTVYVTNSEEFKYTLEKIKGLWGDELKIIEERPDFITTGDIIIVLGLDFSGD